jgi:hypothetical protein
VPWRRAAAALRNHCLSLTDTFPVRVAGVAHEVAARFEIDNALGRQLRTDAHIRHKHGVVTALLPESRHGHFIVAIGTLRTWLP